MSSAACKCLKTTENKWLGLKIAYEGSRTHVEAWRCVLGLGDTCRNLRMVEKGQKHELGLENAGQSLKLG
jgi:hypothetical protein